VKPSSDIEILKRSLDTRIFLIFLFQCSGGRHPDKPSLYGEEERQGLGSWLFGGLQPADRQNSMGDDG
jgi:hypothetical protein